MAAAVGTRGEGESPSLLFGRLKSERSNPLKSEGIKKGMVGMTAEEMRALEAYRRLSTEGKEAAVLFLLGLAEAHNIGFLGAFSELLETLEGQERGKIIRFPGA